MERLVSEIQDNLFVDFNSPEILEIRTAVETLLGHLSGSLKKTHPFFEVSKIVACGSMAEETRNWKYSDGYYIVEFDYLAQLKFPSTFTLQDGCPGFMQILDQHRHIEKYCNRFKSLGTLGALNQGRLAFGFTYDLLKSISVLCNCYRFDTSIKMVNTSDCCKIYSHGTLHKMIQYSEECRCCKVYKPTGVLRLATGATIGSPYFHGCSLVFEWTSNTNQLTPRAGAQNDKSVIILIDFVPAIELRQTKSELGGEGRSLVQLDSKAATEENWKHLYFLVGKGCNKKKHEMCWKISNCVREIRILRETHVSHRHAYMILKYLKECLFSSFPSTTGVPTTYKLKTAVLHHCLACSGSPPKVMTCVLDILQFLTCSYNNHSLRNVTNGLNLLLPERIDKFPTQHITMHYNRCEIIGDCFASTVDLIHQLNNFENVGTFKKYSEAFKLLGQTYEKAWSATEVEIVYKVDRKMVGQTLYQVMAGENVGHKLQSAIYNNGSPCDHWTDAIHPIQYSQVRDMYNFHHMHCPEPVGREVAQKEHLLIECKKNSGYYQWDEESQLEWFKCMKEDKFAQEALNSVYTVEILFVPTAICKPRIKSITKHDDVDVLAPRQPCFKMFVSVKSYLRKIESIFNRVMKMQWPVFSRVLITRLPLKLLFGYLFILLIYNYKRHQNVDSTFPPE
ncbi:uncharacterized protein LOC132551389 [Ylistrum balloti]|uniref:uncharacterized protein LOC132551389 n=1 Tax=Ylistrum balloti TaxID=509963 RepID=UPI002905928E|nr:uncharacterized protein LOC132551389 [Ylistrum balloti]